jgi:hypothetical protein
MRGCLDGRPWVRERHWPKVHQTVNVVDPGSNSRQFVYECHLLQEWTTDSQFRQVKEPKLFSSDASCVA